MKRKVIGLVLLSCSLFVGCGNKQFLNTKWEFNKAKIFIGNEVIEVEVDSWKDYSEDTTIQITGKDGKTYLTDLNNAVLISE